MIKGNYEKDAGNFFTGEIFNFLKNILSLCFLLTIAKLNLYTSWENEEK
jgi:hypothetical protein